MKIIALISMLFGLGSAHANESFAYLGAYLGDYLSAPPDDARLLFHLSTDAASVACDVYVSVDSTNALTGAIYSCNNHPDDFKRYTLDDLKNGISFSRSETPANFFDETPEAITTRLASPLTPPITPMDTTVLVTLSAPYVDAAQGGAVNAHYISNGILGTYSDYPFAIAQVPKSGAWSAFTALDQDSASDPFDQIFLKKRTGFGKVIGVQCVSVSQLPTQPADCSQR